MRRKTNFKVGDAIKIRSMASGHKVLYANLWGSLPKNLNDWWAHEPQKYIGKMFPHDIGFISEKHTGGWVKVLTSNACGWIAERSIEFTENNS